MCVSGIHVSHGQCTSGVKGVLLSVRVRQRQLFVGGAVVCCCFPIQLEDVCDQYGCDHSTFVRLMQRSAALGRNADIFKFLGVLGSAGRHRAVLWSLNLLLHCLSLA